MTRNEDVLERAWQHFHDPPTSATEVVAAELVRLSMTALVVNFYHSHMVPRGYKALSARSLSSLIQLRGDVGSIVKDIIDDAIIAGYHGAVHPHKYNHDAAAEHLSISIERLTQSLLRAAHLK